MKIVEIYKLQNDGSQKIVITCRLEIDKVICEGDRQFVDNLMSKGIFDYSQDSKKKIYPKDGLLFLEQLKYNFKSGYLNASDIKQI